MNASSAAGLLPTAGPERERVTLVTARFIGAGFFACLLVAISQFGRPRRTG